MEVEIWKDIKGYEGLYQVSNLGRVRSITHYIIKENCKPREVKGKILTPFFDRPKGYLSVSLQKIIKLNYKEYIDW